MKKSKYSNIEIVVQDALRKHSKEFILNVNDISNNYSPYSGGGWLDKLSKLILNSYSSTLSNLLNKLDAIIIEGYTYEEIGHIKNIITNRFLESIQNCLQLTSYQTLLHEDNLGREHLVRIVDYLEQDIESTLMAKIAIWKENKKINNKKTVWNTLKTLLRLIKLGA